MGDPGNNHLGIKEIRFAVSIMAKEMEGNIYKNMQQTRFGLQAVVC